MYLLEAYFSRRRSGVALCVAAVCVMSQNHAGSPTKIIFIFQFNLILILHRCKTLFVQSIGSILSWIRKKSLVFCLEQPSLSTL
jgi:hypothetical protein